jgi:hypothetical protein
VIRRFGWVLPMRGAHRPPFANTDASRDVGAAHALIHSRLAAGFGRAYRAKRIGEAVAVGCWEAICGRSEMVQLRSTC